eukprot:Gb_08750 [translate_table: standard]
MFSFVKWVLAMPAFSFSPPRWKSSTVVVMDGENNNVGNSNSSVQFSFLRGEDYLLMRLMLPPSCFSLNASIRIISLISSCFIQPKPEGREEESFTTRLDKVCHYIQYRLKAWHRLKTNLSLRKYHSVQAKTVQKPSKILQVEKED